MYGTIFSTTQKNLPVLQQHYGTPARRRAQLCPRAYYEDRLYTENGKYHDMNTDKILKSKSLTILISTWLHTQDKNFYQHRWKEKTYKNTGFIIGHSLFWIQVSF